jgi:hypothetical protein
VNLIQPGGLLSWDSLLPGNTSRVNIARRVDTSGTQASSNAFFLKNPCVSGINQALVPTTPENNRSRSLQFSFKFRLW